MNKKDERYDIVKNLLDTGSIKEFRQIFLYIPKKIVYSDLGVNYSRFLELIKNTKRFRLEELITLASLFDVDPKTLIDLAYNQYLDDLKGKRKK